MSETEIIPKLTDIRISVIGKELIIFALKTAIDNNKFDLDNIEYIYDLLYGDEDDPSFHDSGLEIVSDKREISFIYKIVEHELIKLIDWILSLKKSLGPGSVNNSILISQCCNVSNKALQLSEGLKNLMNKNGKAITTHKHVFTALGKICDTYEDGTLSIIHSSSDINKKVISKIYEGPKNKFDTISQNLMKELEEIDLEKQKIENELRLFSEIIDPEYQHIVDQYLSAKREIQLIDDYSSKK